jgi:magnesium transporter
MIGSRIQILQETLRRLLRRGATQHVAKVLSKTRAVDIASVLRFFSPKERETIFKLLNSSKKGAEVLSELDYDLASEVIASMSINDAVEILSQISPDDLADIIANLPADLADEFLKKMRHEESSEVEGLMRYDEHTAGGIMSPQFFALPENTTCLEATQKLQTIPDVEMAFYIYVIDEYGHLVGVVSLRQLVISKPETKMKDIMITDVVSVSTDVDQEEVAKLVARYDLLAIPVVDMRNKLVGIITVDDVIDVIREEATEDILKMAGAGDEMVDSWSISRSLKRRLPWLAITWLGGIVAAMMISSYQSTLKSLLPLAAFIPIVIGMGGNVGIQSSTVIVRGLAIGRISVKQLGKTISRELLIGLVLGFFYGILLGVVGFIKYRSLQMLQPFLIGGIIGLSTLSAMMIAALIGTFLPFLFERIRIDPAVATGPLVTSAMDVTGIFVYFSIASFMI